jgi:hypothetical protein
VASACIARALTATTLAVCLALPAAAAADDVSFLLGPGSPFETDMFTAHVRAGDLDGDAFDDVVVAGEGTQARVWFGRSDGGLDAGPVLDSTGGTEHVILADVTGDLVLDVITADTGIKVFPNNGSGTFDQSRPVLSVDAPSVPVTNASGLAVGNFDTDTDNDLAVAANNVVSGNFYGRIRLYANNGTGVFSHAGDIVPPEDNSDPDHATDRTSVGEIVAGRFDSSDAPSDLAYSFSGESGNTAGEGTQILLDAPNLTFTEGPVAQNLGATFAHLDAADIDADGFPDLIALDVTGFGALSVAWGSSAGTFTQRTEVDPRFPVDVAVGDVTGDGGLDVVSVDEPLRVYTRGAPPDERTFTLGAEIDDTGFPFAAAGAFDADARDDLAVTFDGPDQGVDDDLWILLSRQPGLGNPFPDPPAPDPDSDSDPDPDLPAGGDPPSLAPLPGPPMFIPPGNQPPGTVIPVRTNQVAALPSRRPCGSRRKFRIRLRRPPEGVTVVEARVLVNGRRVAVRRGARLTAPVDLRGLPKGRAVVTIRIKLADGRVLRGRRVYRPCATKKRKGRFGRRRAGRG